MIELAAALEGTALAQHLKASRWTYPFVNAGHVFGIALLVGAVIPMDIAILRNRPAVVAFLRPFAGIGLFGAAMAGALLFATQATDYAASPWFQAKMALLIVALLNAAWHLRARGKALRRAAWLSLALWPGVLLLGRLVAYG
ncbi:MAG: hypothetical protein QNJ13_12280 [Paracoccaceae bacterium]|nr:hypothetical protein [Paracoccaceae bacterium]